HIATGFKIQGFTLWQPYHELLNKGGNVVIRHHFTFPFFDPKNLLRDTDFHILLYLDLTGQTHFVFLLGTAQVTHFCRQHFSSPFFHYTSAFPAGTSSTTGGRKENLLGTQGAHQGGSSRNNQWFVRITIDDDFDVSRSHQLGLGKQQYKNK